MGKGETSQGEAVFRAESRQNPTDEQEAGSEIEEDVAIDVEEHVRASEDKTEGPQQNEYREKPATQKEGPRSTARSTGSDSTRVASFKEETGTLVGEPVDPRSILPETEIRATPPIPSTTHP